MSLDALARKLYEAACRVAPKWTDLGQVTRGVWLERVEKKQAGDPYWWSEMPPEWHEAVRRLRNQATHQLRSSYMDNSKQVADLLDEAAEVFTKLSACFRGAGSGGKESAGDGKAGRKVRGKPAATEDLDIDTVREKLKEVADAKGAAAMKAVLKSVGAARLSDVEEDKYQDLMDAADAALAAKGRGKAKKEGVDFDDLATRFKKLVDEDTAAAKKVLKEAGIKKLAEVDQEDDEAMQSLSDAVDAALEGGDDDDLVG